MDVVPFPLVKHDGKLALSQKLGYDKNLYDKMAEKYAANPNQSPVHRILINIAGGKGNS